MRYLQGLTQAELVEFIMPRCVPPVRGRASAEVQPYSEDALAALDPHTRLKTEKRARMRAKQIFHWTYQRGALSFDEMSDISKELREWLKTELEFFRLNARVSKQAEDGTQKFLWDLGDAKTVESVVIPAALQKDDPSDRDDLAEQTDLTELMKQGKRFSGREVDAEAKRLDSGKWGRLTACISSQVGCAMACKFCLTGVQGLDRHLQTHEIVGQIFELRRLAPISNIVFMGMGEPLHNLENVIKACQIFIDPDGFGFSKRKVTVSTSGLVPAIEELGRRVDVSLAISLNASHDEQRVSIMPVNKKWPLEALIGACRRYPLGSYRRITFEYVMLKGINDTVEDAARVLRLLRGIPCKVNVIPFNEHPASEFKRPSDEVVRAFQRHLLDHGVVATVRISRGHDILAACGQLRSLFGTARGTEKHKDYAAGLSDSSELSGKSTSPVRSMTSMGPVSPSVSGAPISSG